MLPQLSKTANLGRYILAEPIYTQPAQHWPCEGAHMQWGIRTSIQAAIMHRSTVTQTPKTGSCCGCWHLTHASGCCGAQAHAGIVAAYLLEVCSGTHDRLPPHTWLCLAAVCSMGCSLCSLHKMQGSLKGLSSSPQHLQARHIRSFLPLRNQNVSKYSMFICTQ